jgi:hypothetical protein
LQVPEEDILSRNQEVLGELDLREVILVINHVDLRLVLALLGCLDDHENPLLKILVDSILLIALILLSSSMIFLTLLLGDFCRSGLKARIISLVLVTK